MIKKILIVLSMILFAGCSDKNILQLKSKKPIVVEHGDFISANPADYLSGEVSEEILNKTVFSLRDTTKTNFKDEILNYKLDENNNIIRSMSGKCPEVGKYTFYLIYNEEIVKELKVEVKDTIPPIFLVITNTIIVIQDTAEVNYERFFTCEDLGGCKIRVDESTVDKSKIGEYKMKVYAYDQYGNENMEEVKVKITDFYETTDDMITEYLDF